MRFGWKSEIPLLHILYINYFIFILVNSPGFVLTPFSWGGDPTFDNEKQFEPSPTFVLAAKSWQVELRITQSMLRYLTSLTDDVLK